MVPLVPQSAALKPLVWFLPSLLSTARQSRCVIEHVISTISPRFREVSITKLFLQAFACSFDFSSFLLWDLLQTIHGIILLQYISETFSKWGFSGLSVLKLWSAREIWVTGSIRVGKRQRNTFRPLSPWFKTFKSLDAVESTSTEQTWFDRRVKYLRGNVFEADHLLPNLGSICTSCVPWMSYLTFPHLPMGIVTVLTS